MNYLNTHPLYPKRSDIDIEYYDKKCQVYEDLSLKAGYKWSDPENISIEELHTRGVWEWNYETPEIVTLKESDIKFKDGKPVTPIKTGIKGRGLLGKFGPNHAADPIITCWINDELYFIGVQRNDTNEWAIPGGMVPPGKDVYESLRDKFIDKTCNDCEDAVLDKIFDKKNSEIMYAGPTYEDPRTTDSAWIETFVVHYHIETELANKIKLTPQKREVKNVKWVKCNEYLYGGHKNFIDIVKQKMEREKIFVEPSYDEPINMENFYEIFSVFAYLVVTLISIFYAFQLRQDLKNEEKYITSFLCDYDNCHSILFENTYAIPFNTTS